MHVLALGGAGDMGRAVLRVVSEFPEVERITVADIDAAAATTTATSLGAKARTLELDVLDATGMDKALAEADVVLNTCGPFFRYGLTILKASIAAGKPYFDMCDDPEPTLGMFTHDRAARNNQTLAVIGLGATPGLTNLLALTAYRQLDEVERLYACWNVDGQIAAAEFGYEYRRTSAAYIHWMSQLTGDISVYRSGARTLEKPLSGVTIRYPGRGKRQLYRCGQPEGVTLGRNFPELLDTGNLMVLSGPLRIYLTALAGRVNSGKLNVEQAAEHLAHQNRSAIDLDSKLKILFARLKSEHPMPELFAIAEGKKDGKPKVAAATLTAYPGQSVAEIAGVSLALGLRLYLDGKLTDTGVHAPETIINPDDFFAAYLPYCQASEAPVTAANLIEVSTQ